MMIDDRKASNRRHWAALQRRVGLLALVLAPVAADAAEIDDLDRWAPALSVSFDVLGQKADGSIANGPVIGPPLPEGCLRENRPRDGQLCPRLSFEETRDTQIRPDVAGHDTMVAPLVDVSLELLTPKLLDAVLQPRLFARGDLAIAFGFERKIAGEVQPGPFERPAFLQPDAIIPEITISGQGSRLFAQLHPLVFSGGAGVAFTGRFFGRTMRVKPSFEYLRERLEIKGAVRRAVALLENSRSMEQDFRYIVLRDETTETYHGFGAGIEIEVDTLRVGPIRSAVFVAGRGYRFAGSLETTLHDTNEFGETASWRFAKEPWAWRAGAGIRFRWAPEW